jgi:putative hydrolase
MRPSRPGAVRSLSDLAVDRGRDLHTHSDITDGTASPDDMADAALAAGLRVWGLADHVRADTTWLPDYATRIRGLSRPEMVILCGVEAKILDSAGRLDLPRRLPRLDYILVADHQFPSVDGPLHPDETRRRIASGSISRVAAVDTLVAATCSALARVPGRAVLAHLFSLLPKMGLSEDDVSGEHRAALAAACRAAGAAVEVNEKWRCPSARTLSCLAAAGVEVLAGSDAHRPADVGRWDYLSDIEETLGMSDRAGR